MSEVAFAKQFLATLDNRPIKRSSDHVEDPKKYPSQSAYILPRMPKPFPKSTTSTSAAPPSASAITVCLKSLSSSSTPALDERLPDQPLSTSVHDLKTHCARKTGYDTSKIKILLNKKPCADSKTLKELLPTEGDPPESLELHVMFIGAPVSAPAAPDAAPLTGLRAAPGDDVEMTVAGEPVEPVAAEGAAALGTSGKDVLETEQFWADLRGFLVQRLRSEDVAGEVLERFEGAWRGQT